MARKLLIASGFCWLLLATAGMAKADTMETFNLDQSASWTAPNPPGYFGTVTLNQVSNGSGGYNVDVKVQLYVGSDPSKPDFEFLNTAPQNTNSHESFTFYSSPQITSSQITNVTSTSIPGASGATWSFDSGSPTQAGYGTFNFYLNCTSCGPGASNYPNNPYELGFTVLDATLGTFTANSNGYYFAADVYDNFTGATGNVASNTLVPVVPEPPSLLLLVTGLILLAATLKTRQLAAGKSKRIA